MGPADATAVARRLLQSAAQLAIHWSGLLDRRLRPRREAFRQGARGPRRARPRAARRRGTRRHRDRAGPPARAGRPVSARPRAVQHLRVLRDGELADVLARTARGATFTYDRELLDRHPHDRVGIATHLPPSASSHESRGANLHPFFANLLPEGARLGALLAAARSAKDDTPLARGDGRRGHRRRHLARGRGSRARARRAGARRRACERGVVPCAVRGEHRVRRAASRADDGARRAGEDLRGVSGLRWGRSRRCVRRARSRRCGGARGCDRKGAPPRRAVRQGGGA